MTEADSASSTQLDRIDRLLLDHLADDGRATITELADAISVSPSSAQRRLRRLESAGVIRGYRAVLDPAALGRALVVYLAVVLTDHSGETVDRFERGIVDVEGLVSAHHVTGDVDFLLRIDVADVDALDTLLRRTLTQVPGVARFTTMVATSGLVDRVSD